jgi:ABC-type uncharacterized transport system permease subunit
VSMSFLNDPVVGVMRGMLNGRIESIVTERGAKRNFLTGVLRACYSIRIFRKSNIARSVSTALCGYRAE